MKRFRYQQRTQEQGSYLVLAAFVVIVLVITAALAVDISRKMQLEQKLQDVADAAAMAGAAMLPDAARARATCTTYIQQAASDYIPADSDVQIVVSANNRSGTVGVIVKGAWDPIIMPDWIVGGDIYGVSRFAVAVMSYETTATITYGDGDFSNPPSGPYALFVGESGALTSSQTKNNCEIRGSAHFNHTADANDITVLGGTFEAAAVAPGSFISGATEIPSGYEMPPVIDKDRLLADVRLDVGHSNAAAYYTSGVSKNVVRPGPDNLYGTPDDIPLRMDGGGIVTATWNAGTQTWTVITGSGAGSSVSGSGGGQNNGIGLGVDISIIGNVDFHVPKSSGGGGQQYWKGSIQVSGKFSNSEANCEVRCVFPDDADHDVDGNPTLDNPGLAVYSGYALPPGSLAFDATTTGNAMNIYGMIYADGSLKFDGNMSAPASSNPGTTGLYNATGNGFIRGSMYCDDLSLGHGGGLVANSTKIWYDGDILPDIPIENSPTQSPPRFSTPTVWLQR